MYAIIATDSDIIDCVRKNIVDELAPSMGENVTQDMEAIEYVVDNVNDNGGRVLTPCPYNNSPIWVQNFTIPQ